MNRYRLQEAFKPLGPESTLDAKENSNMELGAKQ